jgi:hypothetical protein
MMVLLLSGAGREVFAADRVQGSDDCAGMMPSNLPESRTVLIGHPQGVACGHVTVDGLGNVAAAVEGSGGGLWHVFNPEGVELGTFGSTTIDLMPQSIGFQGLWRECHDVDCNDYPSSWQPDGTRRINRRGIYTTLYQSHLERIQDGGSQILVIPWYEVSGLPITLIRLDAAGMSTAESDVVRVNETGRWVVGAVDLNGLTLLVFMDGARLGFGENDLAARWYDGTGLPISDYFVLWTSEGTRSNPWLRPLIGGGIALQIEGNWVAMSPGGKAVSTAVPDWLAARSNFDIEIVRGGRAHALIPKWPVPDRSTIPLYSPTGSHCGDATFPQPNVTVGIDGTVISSTGDDACTITWWPHVLP